MVNLADDGDKTRAYFVDNNNSVSRLRMTATGQVTDDLTAGANLELAISPNNSAEVSQEDEDGSQRDEFRKAEAVFDSESYGEVSLGRGDPATKDIARLGLSGTDVLAYASTGDIAGGLLLPTRRTSTSARSGRA
jgi:predicted porin